MKTRRIFASLVLLCLFLLPSSNLRASATTAISLSSQEDGLGPEYNVGYMMDPTRDQHSPSIAYDATHHRTLLVWQEHASGLFHIIYKLLDQNGKPLINSSFMSSNTPRYQPAALWDAETGNYLIVWMRDSNLDGKTYSIWGEMVDFNLTTVKSEFSIYEPPANSSCWTPRVAKNGVRDEIMIVCSEYDISAWPSMIPTRIVETTIGGIGDYNSHTFPVGGPNHQYPINADVIYADDYTHNGFGQFFLVWTQYNNDTHNNEITAELVDAGTGLPGASYRLDQSYAEKDYPRVATNGNNRFVVAWQERSSDGDWDIYGRLMNGAFTFFGDLHYIAAEGETDEKYPYVIGWPGTAERFAVAYERASDTGTDVWLNYYNAGTGTINFSNITFWLDNFPAAAYSYYENTSPVGVSIGARLQLAYLGISTDPEDHNLVYERTWTPFTISLPLVRK